MAWEVEDHDGIVVADKPGGLNNSSTYIGLVLLRSSASQSS
jgi:hypothetical protein